MPDNNDEKMVRLQYEPGESGWAVDLGDGRYRIANVPYSEKLNIDDIVTVRPQPGRNLPIVDQIVERGFADKVAVWYDHVDQFRAVTIELKKLGCKSEGVVGPGATGRGVMIVATPEGVDALKVARDLGVVAPESKDRPASV